MAGGPAQRNRSAGGGTVPADVAAAEAGTLRLHREPVRADELLAQVAAAHRVAADSAGIRLVTTVGGCLWLDADPVRMRQVRGNLVSNAIRHTPADGTITNSARVDGEEIVFEVADTGSGIVPGDLPHVFDRLWRAEKSRSRRTRGSGLGLPIVRRLASAHGGVRPGRRLGLHPAACRRRRRPERSETPEADADFCVPAGDRPPRGERCPGGLDAEDVNA